jgi:hypothetical protein
MQRLGIFAVTALALALAGGGAMAATGDQSGELPAPLAGLKPPPETKAHAPKPVIHAKAGHKTRHQIAAHKPAVRTKLASKTPGVIASTMPNEQPSPAVPAALPDNVWPAPQATPPAEVAATAQPAAAPQDNEPAPSAVVVGAQTVQVAAPDQVNEIDLAAHDASAATAMPTDLADATPAPQTAFAAPVHRDADAVGGGSWLAQVLAALGGAAAAGAVAWFLIGSGPVRLYG